MIRISQIIRTIKPENLLFLIPGITLAPYVFLALFAVPSADDFYQAVHSLQRGAMGFTIWRYLTWSGRYASDLVISSFNILGQHVAGHFLIRFYYLVPILILSIYIASCYLFMALIAEESKPRWRFFFALLSTILMVSHVELRSTVFWLAGAATYTIGNSLLLISLAITLASVYIKSESRKIPSLIALNVPLVFLVNGFNEVVMLSNTVILSGLIAFSVLLRHLNKSDFCKLFPLQISAIAATFLVALAPGNAIRMGSSDGYKLEVWQAMLKSLWAMAHYLNLWISPVWLIFCIILILTSHHFISPKLEQYIISKRRLFPLVASLLAALYTSYFVRFYSQGFEGALRTNAVSFVIFFVLTCVVCLHGGARYQAYRQTRNTKDGQVLLAVCLFCLLATGANSRLLVSDLRELKTHYSYYQAVYPALISGKEIDDFKVSREPEVSVMRWKCYLTDDTQYWTNVAVANYFQVRSVKAIGGGAPDSECGGVESYQKNRG